MGLSPHNRVVHTVNQRCCTCQAKGGGDAASIVVPPHRNRPVR